MSLCIPLCRSLVSWIYVFILVRYVYSYFVCSFVRVFFHLCISIVLYVCMYVFLSVAIHVFSFVVSVLFIPWLFICFVMSFGRSCVRYFFVSLFISI